jgi:GNAT superfamily N-acetyltransferase
MQALIRPARPDDLEELLAMQLRSLRELAGPHYDAELLEAALAEIGTMDPRMIGQCCYLVAECDGRIRGGAGWTMRMPSYARLVREPLPPLDGHTGLIRSVYVDPAATRQGLARALLATIEATLRDGGATRAELIATLPCVPIYAALGYEAISDHAVVLAGRMEFPVRRMGRALAPGVSPVIPLAVPAAPGPAAAAAG